MEPRKQGTPDAGLNERTAKCRAENDCARCPDDCGGICATGIPFLEGLGEARRDAIRRRTVHMKLGKGDKLFAWRDPVDSLFIIRSGRVKLCRWDAEGREQIVGIFADGDIIWEGLFLAGSTYPYSGVALSEVTACRLYRADLETILTDPAAAMRVIGLLSRKLHDANKRSLILSTARPKARIARFLTYRLERSTADAIVLRLEDIAASVALRPETVSRKLGEMENDGIITKTGQSVIRVPDVEKLKKLFKG